jgi:hypothetical protein
MSNYDFWCPNCGQKMSGDPTYRGKTIGCPACKRTMTVPVRPIEAGDAAPSAAGGSPGPASPPGSGSKPAGSTSSPSGPSAKKPAVKSGASKLAVAAVIGSVIAIPGIICGHLALASSRKASPKDRQLALTGLVISYCVLAAALAVFAIYTSRTLHKPKLVMRDDPKTGAVTQARIVDEVKMADEASETAHQVKAVRSLTGEYNGRTFRATRRRNGGSFSYTMKVLPGEPMTLNCTYWGNDTDHRQFDISVNDQLIATQKIDFNAPGHFFDVEYPIPTSLTRGKNEVTVQFLSQKGMTAGGVFGCQMLKK